MTSLNFDPYAALAEIESGRERRAKRANAANPVDAPNLAHLALLAGSAAQTAKTDAVTDPAQWEAALARLDATTAPDGFTSARWRELVYDARWLAERHGSCASALGWTASDLFGLHEQLDCWGGLADRLSGARRASFTDSVARWRSDAEDGWLWRRTLRPMMLVWEAPGGAKGTSDSPPSRGSSNHDLTPAPD